MTTIDRLIALCEKATPGPWRVESGASDYPNVVLIDVDDGSDRYIVGNEGFYRCDGSDEHNADFIAACDPQTILALCAENKRLTEEVERLRGEGWQPIETAPMDGTSVLGYREGYKRIMVWWYYNNRWSCDASYHAGPWDPPTHWMPILPFSGVPAHSTSAAAEGAVTVTDEMVTAAIAAHMVVGHKHGSPSTLDRIGMRHAIQAALSAAPGGERK